MNFLLFVRSQVFIVDAEGSGGGECSDPSKLEWSSILPLRLYLRHWETVKC